MLGVLTHVMLVSCCVPYHMGPCAAAASGGHLEVLQWARGHGCPWDILTCTYAAEGGHFEVLKWARERNCPWNQEVSGKA